MAAGLRAPIDDACNSETRDSRNARQPFERLFRLLGVRELDHKAVARLRDALEREAFQSAANGFAQLVQEKFAISLLEPQFVVVDDDVRGHHDFSVAWTARC